MTLLIDTVDTVDNFKSVDSVDNVNSVDSVNSVHSWHLPMLHVPTADQVDSKNIEILVLEVSGP